MNDFTLISTLNIAAFGLTAILSYFFTKNLINLSYHLDFLDYPAGRKAHKAPMPFLGGAGVFFAFWAVVFAAILLGFTLNQRMPGSDAISRIVRGTVSLAPKVGGIFAGGSIIFVVGLLDDKFRWRPRHKLLGQIAATLVLMGLGFAINIFEGLGPLGYFITFIWILLIINAFNFIDSLDGHCAGIALISTLMFFWLTQIITQPIVGFFLITFAGALAGFLPHNFKPAKIFLGDNGSLFIGYMLASFTLLCSYQVEHATYVTTFIPVLIFAVPIYDTLSVIVVRLGRGVAPWQGDRNHFAHRLVKVGMSEKTAVIFSYFIATTIGLVAILTTQVGQFGAILIGLIFCCIIGVIAFLEFYTTERIRMIEKIAKKHRRKHGNSTDTEEAHN
jgi:UDP-GlcNAc:undecaprenyl-phosphate GlcNAc-1-phosphate transferase